MNNGFEILGPFFFKIAQGNQQVAFILNLMTDKNSFQDFTETLYVSVESEQGKAIMQEFKLSQSELRGML